MATADKTIRFVVSAAAAMPSWYPATAGTIINLSSVLGDASTQFSAADAAGAAAYPAPTYDSRRLDPYSGGALVYNGGRPFLYCYGGGHLDGSWNGIIQYGPLYGAGSNNPTWSLAEQATALATVNAAATDTTVYPDGRPSAQHTYNMLTGLGSRMYAPVIGVVYGSGNGALMRPYYYDNATDSWNVYAATVPNTGSTGAGGGCVAYNNRLFFFPGSGFLHPLKIFDIGSSTWSVEPNAYAVTYGDTAMLAVDTLRGALLCHGSSAGSDGVYWPSLVAPYAGRRTNMVRPPSTASNSMEYDADRDVFVVPVAGSRDVYECSAASLAAGNPGTWSTRTFAGATPSAQAGTGTKGRFRYVPELQGYINVPAAQSQVFFYRST